jgi:hypothetical protein
MSNSSYPVSDPDPDPQALDADPLSEYLCSSDEIRIHNFTSNYNINIFASQGGACQAHGFRVCEGEQ